MGRSIIQFIGALVRYCVFTPIRKVLGMKTFDFYTYLLGPENPENWEDSVNYAFANSIAFVVFWVVMGYLIGRFGG